MKNYSSEQRDGVATASHGIPCLDGTRFMLFTLQEYFELPVRLQDTRSDPAFSIATNKPTFHRSEHDIPHLLKCAQRITRTLHGIGWG